MKKKMYFVSGLPRSGATPLVSLLNQNPTIHGEASSSLCNVFKTVNNSWSNFEANIVTDNNQSKKGVLKYMLDGYYDHIDKPVIVDKNVGWIPQISTLESVLDSQVKIVVCVRNPAEILTSFEKARKENPLLFSKVDYSLGDNSNVASRAYYYASPEGLLGSAHRNLKDTITMGYLNRLLFVDYNRLCNSPKSQIKRIYDFLELPLFEHDLENVQYRKPYNNNIVGLPNSCENRSKIDRTVVNCVEYLGLDLYEQYNREIFWNVWI